MGVGCSLEDIVLVKRQNLKKLLLQEYYHLYDESNNDNH
jgi:hypothetical protein